ncbi:hypothetical protein RP20_CCG020679 [Aedes albopictus]|nr:hypothetical protein RP20_CCG020679 [Aedes albopictus]
MKWYTLTASSATYTLAILGPADSDIVYETSEDRAPAMVPKSRQFHNLIVLEGYFRVDDDDDDALRDDGKDDEGRLVTALHQYPVDVVAATAAV